MNGSLAGEVLIEAVSIEETAIWVKYWLPLSEELDRVFPTWWRP